MKDLDAADRSVCIEEIVYLLVDAAAAGFAFASYEAVHEEITGERRFPVVDGDALEVIAVQAQVVEPAGP
ncbi:MAG: hypothetical protein AAF657_36250 [Acidobacteriota bacterium]